MTVNNEQIAQLYAFTRKHYVVYYDLQTELVDHLAMGIEKQWEENPDRDFDAALQREFKKFGVFGFTEIVEKRQVAMGKRYRSFIWSHVKEYFSIPKILLVIVATLSMFFILTHLDYQAESVMLISSGLFVAYFIAIIIDFKRKQKAKKDQKERLWMLEDMIQRNGAGLGLAWMPFYLMHFMIHVDDHKLVSEISPVWLGILSFSFVMICITYYVMTSVIPKHAKVYLHETYPEYKLIEG